MWSVINHTPFSVDKCFQRADSDAAEHWVVVLKATFDISPSGKLSVAKKQEPVNAVAVYIDEENDRGLLYPRDLIIGKHKTDILINALAFAPGNQSCEQFNVDVQVGDWNKQLKITGDRYWQKTSNSWAASKATKIDTLPLCYQYAYGGRHVNEDTFEEYSANPAGTGFALSNSDLTDVKLPNIEYPYGETTPDSEQNKVAGFCAIANHWEPRLNYLGTHDEQWKDHRFPLRPLDFNAQFYQCAPTDQQLERLNGGERVVLRNLSESGRVEFVLPSLAINFVTQFDGATIKQQADLHTVIIEPQKSRLIMVWHSSLKCNGKDHLIEKTEISHQALNVG